MNQVQMLENETYFWPDYQLYLVQDRAGVFAAWGFPEEHWIYLWVPVTQEWPGRSSRWR